MFLSNVSLVSSETSITIIASRKIVSLKWSLCVDTLVWRLCGCAQPSGCRVPAGRQPGVGAIGWSSGRRRWVPAVPSASSVLLAGRGLGEPRDRQQTARPTSPRTQGAVPDRGGEVRGIVQ